MSFRELEQSQAKVIKAQYPSRLISTGTEMYVSMDVEVGERVRICKPSNVGRVT